MIFLRKKEISTGDEELLKRFREWGDLDSLGSLYNRYIHLVYGVCLKYLADREEAKDEVMNIFEKLVGMLPGQEVTNFKGWLYVVTKNHCLMVLRSRRNEEVHLDAYLADPLSGVEFNSVMHLSDEDESFDHGRLEECIGRLKEEQRRCIDLFYYQGLSYRQICDQLEMDEKKVKSYIQNGKRNLRICMEGR